jgi:hypothetical protein
MIVFDWNGNPGDGWDVAGVSDATKDHTLVRKASVTEGNGGDWDSSAGTNEDDSEWIVLDENTWDYLGSHPHDFTWTGLVWYVSTTGSDDNDGSENNPFATIQKGLIQVVMGIRF